MAWRNAHKIPLIGVFILEAIVVVCLGLVTYSSPGSTASASAGLLWLCWILAAVVLAMLCRLAWQIWTGRHQTRLDTKRR